MRSYIVKENHIGSMVRKFLDYRQTDNKTYKIKHPVIVFEGKIQPRREWTYF